MLLKGLTVAPIQTSFPIFLRIFVVQIIKKFCFFSFFVVFVLYLVLQISPFLQLLVLVLACCHLFLSESLSYFLGLKYCCLGLKYCLIFVIYCFSCLCSFAFVRSWQLFLAPYSIFYVYANCLCFVSIFFFFFFFFFVFCYVSFNILYQKTSLFLFYLLFRSR